ncbi:relaxase/mobilization nuclease domain-containing protein [Actinokineospora sp. 24-640]
MIAEVTRRGRRGSDTKGLLRYLFGPGRANEHTDPHVVAAWAPEWVRDHPLGGDLADSASTPTGRSRLASQLDGLMTGHGVNVDNGHVYHVVLSLPPADLPVDPATGERSRLPDEQWRDLAESGIAALGLAADDHGRNGCRWVAVHHGPSANGNDHVHLVVNIVRANGDTANLHRDFLRWRDWCRIVEDQHDWTATAPAGQGAISATSRRELARATDTGIPTEREQLRELVAAAAATTRSEIEFVQSLRGRGVLLAAHPLDSASAVTGYKVALVPAVDEQEPVWFGGSTLRRDLSLPRLRERWNSDLLTGLQHMVWREHRYVSLTVEPADDLRTLTKLGQTAIRKVTATLDDADAHTWHRIAERAADIALAFAPHDTTVVLVETHTYLARAAQLPARRPPLAETRHLQAVRALTNFARAAARTEHSGAAMLALGIAVVLLVVTALRDSADRRNIRAAACEQINTAAYLLEHHPARTSPAHEPEPQPSHQPAMRPPRRAPDGTRTWRPPTSPAAPPRRGR